jgi:phage-related protein
MAGPAGFKIADGYVEVHAHYDKGDLQRAARAVVGDINTGVDRGLRVNSVGRRIAVATERDVDQHRSRFRLVGERIARGITAGLIGPRGAPVAAAAFMRNFVEAVTFGQADFGRIRTAGWARAFAGAGTALGAVLAAALILEIGNAITALLPLALSGAFLALPVIHLLRTKDFKDDIKKLKAEWRSFIAFISEPVKVPLQQALQDLGTMLNRLKIPMREILTAISPAAGAAFRGFLDGIVAFVKAIQPALPGIVAGLREWAVQAPILGKALGEMFSAIMKDPALVVQAVKTFVDTLVFLSRILGVLIPLLTRIAPIFHNVASGLVVGARAAQALVAAWNWLTGALGRAWTSLKQNMSMVGADIKRVWDGVVAFFRGIPGKVQAAFATLKAKIITPFQNAFDSARAKVEAFVARVAAFLKSLPGKAGAAVSSLWSRMSGAFNSAVNNARAKASDLVSRVITFLKSLPGKARSAVSALWSSMSGAFSTAVSRAKTAATNLVNGFINTLKGIVAKARAQVNAAKSAIIGAFSGAGSWLVGAGRAIISGLASGIRSGASAAISAAASVARSALAAAKSALGISSPSKVFAEQVGKPISQGIGVGMRKSLPAEFASMQKMLPRLDMAQGRAPMAAVAGGGGFNPTIILNMQPGFYSENAAARRALTKDVFLALEQYRKDYIDR